MTTYASQKEANDAGTALGVPFIVEAVSDNNGGFVYIVNTNIPTPQPNLLGFQQAMLANYGAAKINALISKYPLFTLAIAAGDFQTMHDVLELAITNGDLTASDKVVFQSALNAQNIPITL